MFSASPPTKDLPRDRILSHGIGIASTMGLKGVTLAEIARDLDVSRSGLTRLFPSKDDLQLAVLAQAADTFTREVAEPALQAPVGESRVRGLFANWIQWSRSPKLKGGCPFVHASAEADLLPDAVRTQLQAVLDQWSVVLTGAIVDAREAGHFASDLDAEQLAFELYGLYLSHHFWHWSMRDASASQRTLKAFERLIAASRPRQS